MRRKHRGFRRSAAAILLSACMQGCRASEGNELKLIRETIGADVTVVQTESNNVAVTKDECSSAAVYLCGEVKMPGVYILDSSARLYEAVEAAGGFTENADEKAVNLARQVADGEQVIIPAEGESLAEPSVTAGRYESSLIDINTASKEELMRLPGIGETKAGSIVSYRNEHGGFSSLEEIMNVPGIKQAAFEQIRQSITLSTER